MSALQSGVPGRGGVAAGRRLKRERRWKTDGSASFALPCCIPQFAAIAPAVPRLGSDRLPVFGSSYDTLSPPSSPPLGKGSIFSRGQLVLFLDQTILRRASMEPRVRHPRRHSDPSSCSAGAGTFRPFSPCMVRLQPGACVRGSPRLRCPPLRLCVTESLRESPGHGLVSPSGFLGARAVWSALGSLRAGAARRRETPSLPPSRSLCMRLRKVGLHIPAHEWTELPQNSRSSPGYVDFLQFLAVRRKHASRALTDGKGGGGQLNCI